MARTLFGNYSITELRRYATEYKIPLRSKMTGERLLTAVLAYWDAQRVAKEQAVLPAVRVGALLRHASSGYIIRVTSDVFTWQPHGALYVTAEYVELNGWGDDRRTERAAYQNDNDRRRTERGEIVRHPIWQYEAV